MRADRRLTTRLKNPHTWIYLIFVLTLLGLATGRLAPVSAPSANASAPTAGEPIRAHAATGELGQAQWLVSADAP